MTNKFCPVHNDSVFKVEASGGIGCPIWDPGLGLTIDQIRNRFPYAVWDSNIHHLDESPNAKFPYYYLICDRCMASWSEYVSVNSPYDRDSRFIISVTSSGKILINDTEFSIEQIPAVAKTVSIYQTDPRVNLRAHGDVSTEQIKSIVKACEKGGLSDIIFGSYIEESDRTRKSSSSETE